MAPRDAAPVSAPRPAKRVYERPQLSSVPVSPGHALLAVCSSTPSGPQVFQGAPCNACFQNS